jgi:hypothetical protein
MGFSNKITILELELEYGKNFLVREVKDLTILSILNAGAIVNHDRII